MHNQIMVVEKVELSKTHSSIFTGKMQVLQWTIYFPKEIIFFPEEIIFSPEEIIFSPEEIVFSPEEIIFYPREQGGPKC